MTNPAKNSFNLHHVDDFYSADTLNECRSIRSRAHRLDWLVCVAKACFILYPIIGKGMFDDRSNAIAQTIFIEQKPVSALESNGGKYAIRLQNNDFYKYVVYTQPVLFILCPALAGKLYV